MIAAAVQQALDGPRLGVHAEVPNAERAELARKLEQPKSGARVETTRFLLVLHEVSK